MLCYYLLQQFFFIFNMSLLILLSLVIFLSKRDFITIFFKSFDFSVDSFAFSTKICLFLNFPQMFMAVLKSNSESSGPCIETIINPCNMVLVRLFLNVVFTLDIQRNPLSHSEIERTINITKWTNFHTL